MVKAEVTKLRNKERQQEMQTLELQHFSKGLHHEQVYYGTCRHEEKQSRVSFEMTHGQNLKGYTEIRQSDNKVIGPHRSSFLPSFVLE